MQGMYVGVGQVKMELEEEEDVKLELAKYYKDSETTAFFSERSRNSK